MAPLLEFESVNKTYGKKAALRDIALTIEPGRIVGLLGSNGSGKSTLLRLAAGLNRPDSGKIRVLGHEPGKASKALVSFMPDRPQFEKWMTVGEALDFQRDFFADYDPDKSKRMLEFMKLSRRDKASTLSKGMQERLQLTLALSRRSSLYLLDEPIGGVDPVARDHILDALVEFYEEDSSVIVSTHLIADIERIFDEVLMIRDGSLLLQREVEQLRMESGKSVDQLFKEVYAEC
ncbi:multidrug ABC transporter ATP-binding protein [Saccharibacillus sp. O23]|uniref:ABC transporter ATP-binding protein n=1 Tax=Saccharibacillus sp. O23 TaxID=2009338 RepID=UPI000B4E8048|nr:ABC transporter ATP-binding protein [Saccharibacillus sp. O23]OWR29015.1 multidrug ABC transporter ATP-binding protein [Saccharibacillus sp. O23]